MKKLILALTFMCAIFSCTTDENLSNDQLVTLNENVILDTEENQVYINSDGISYLDMTLKERKDELRKIKSINQKQIDLNKKLIENHHRQLTQFISGKSMRLTELTFMCIDSSDNTYWHDADCNYYKGTLYGTEIITEQEAFQNCPQQ